MKLKIINMKFKYFAKFRTHELDLQGTDAVISGANAAGKTSLANGLTWLFFGKSTDGSKFNPKPLDENNDEILGQEPEVEATLEIDGKLVDLKRIQKEVWTKRAGESEKVRGSDSTKYFIDSVPKKEKEWKDYISEICNDQLFELLINPSKFMQINWKDRREILVNMTGLTDGDIIAQSDELKDLYQTLNGHSVDDMRKILASDKKLVAEQIKDIPGRIQENLDGIERLGLDELNLDELDQEINIAKQEVSVIEDNIQRLKAGQGDSVLKEELSKLHLKFTERKNSFLSGAMLATQSIQDDYNIKQQELNAIRNEVNKKNAEKNRLVQALDEKMQVREHYLNEFYSISALTFDDHATTCKMCGQDLPSDQVAKMIENFNSDKSKKLESNKAKAEELGFRKEDIASLKESISKVEGELTVLNVSLNTGENFVSKLNQELTSEKERQGDFESTEEAQNIIKEINEINLKIADLNNDSSTALNGEMTNLTDAKNVLDELGRNRLKFDQVSGFEKQIAALKDKDSEYKKRLNEIEHKQFLLDEFTRAKVRILEESINSKFEMVKFKLFEIQKNGGLNEVCEATYNGVPYSSGLNNGARINCDLDIANTLAKEFNVYLPVFVDNAESVNELIAIDSQKIELRVAANKRLKVEVA